MSLVVDDQVLSAVLRGVGPDVEGPLHTTGLWYVRLCQAVVRAQGGVLSAPFTDLPAPLGEHAVAAVLELPQHIGLPSLRVLAPTMAVLAERHQLNLLSREALAAALALDGTLVVADTNRNPPLLAAAAIEGVPVEIIDLG